ncbi:AAA family ATPase [Rhodocyclus tenuis]|uniref:AAA family ATPase n=1 Tax=Rhodocyclus tenuis TaxID=1066 RepID=UPI001907E397|nr:AAA family ATPase [Rhodocyclus tenuis]
MTEKFNPFRPSPILCVGREAISKLIISNAVDRRCVLLFGGRQSGKTTLLLSVAQTLRREASVCELESYLCPVYVDLTRLPVEATPTDFFNLLIDTALVQCASTIKGFSIPENSLLENVTVDSFAKNIQAITKNAGEVDLTLLFLIDEAGRVLGERFPRGFQDNLFSLLYGPELAIETKLGIVFAGAQELFKFSEDQTSPIGSRAAYSYMGNLGLDGIKKLRGVINSVYGHEIPEALDDEIYQLTGGNAGVTGRLCKTIIDQNVTTKESLAVSLEAFYGDCSQLMRLWSTSLSSKARKLHDSLAGAERLPKTAMLKLFQDNGWDPLLLERAVQELLFTGIAQYKDRVLSKTCSIYWESVSDFFVIDAENESKVDGGTPNGEFYDAVWALIERAELSLRAYIRSEYSKKFGDKLQAKITQALGASSAAKVMSNVTKSNGRYRYTQRDVALDIFDGLYLGQMAQLMIWGEAWPAFQHLVQDKRELEMLMAPVNAVRTDKAHFYKVPERELLRCKLHCEDLLSLIQKYLPEDQL